MSEIHPIYLDTDHEFELIHSRDILEVYDFEHIVICKKCGIQIPSKEEFDWIVSERSEPVLKRWAKYEDDCWRILYMPTCKEYLMNEVLK